MVCLGIPHRQDQRGATPGTLRGSGATFLYSGCEDPAWIAWRGRWSRVRTLEYYLQEVAAQLLIHELSPVSRSKIQILSNSAWHVLASVLSLRGSKWGVDIEDCIIDFSTFGFDESTVPWPNNWPAAWKASAAACSEHGKLGNGGRKRCFLISWEVNHCHWHKAFFRAQNPRPPCDIEDCIIDFSTFGFDESTVPWPNNWPAAWKASAAACSEHGKLGNGGRKRLKLITIILKICHLYYSFLISFLLFR